MRSNGFDIHELYVYSLQQLDPPARDAALSWPGYIRSYLRALPRRLVVPLLYKITPFFGEGIIVVGKLPGHLQG